MPLKTATEPGAKPFDYYLAQVPYSPELSQAVDLSDGYFDVNQAVLSIISTEEIDTAISRK